MAGIAGVNQNDLLHLGVGQIAPPFVLRKPILRDHRPGAGLAHRFDVFFQRVVPAQQGRADRFGGQQQINEFRDRREKDRDLIALPKAKRAQGAGGILRLVEYGTPSDLAAVEFYGGHTVAGAVAAQIFLDRAVGQVDHPLQHFGIVLHPGTVDAGFAGHRGGAHNRILLFLLLFFFLLSFDVARRTFLFHI